MKIFAVNKEFGLSLPTTTFYLHEGDIVWIDEIGVGLGDYISYIVGVEYQFSEFNGNPSGRKIFKPKNRCVSAWCDKTLKIKNIQNLIDEKFIHDITTVYERDKKLEKWIN